MLGVRTGVKTRDNALWQQRPPALLHDLAGVHVEEYFALREPVQIAPEKDAPPWLRGPASIWAEWLVPHPGTKVMARYEPSNGWLDAQAAITVKQHPSGGAVWVLGAWLDDPLQDTLLGWIAEQAGVQPHCPCRLRRRMWCAEAKLTSSSLGLRQQLLSCLGLPGSTLAIASCVPLRCPHGVWLC